MFDYTNQVRAFERMIALDPFSLSRSAQVLWMRLNSIVDRQRKSLTVHIYHKELEKLLGGSETIRRDAVNELVQSKLITFRNGMRNNPPMYQIKLLYREGGDGK